VGVLWLDEAFWRTKVVGVGVGGDGFDADVVGVFVAVWVGADPKHNEVEVLLGEGKGWQIWDVDDVGGFDGEGFAVGVLSDDVGDVLVVDGGAGKALGSVEVTMFAKVDGGGLVAGVGVGGFDGEGVGF